MADDTAPEDSGTTEEQQENDIAVQAVEAEQEQAGEQEDDEMDMAEQIQEAQDLLAALAEDPENVGVLGIVVNTKNGLPEELADDPENPADGETWRVVNPDLDGYGDVQDVVATLAGFNAGLEDAEVTMERPSGPMGLGAMLGLE